MAPTVQHRGEIDGMVRQCRVQPEYHQGQKGYSVLGTGAHSECFATKTNDRLSWAYTSPKRSEGEKRGTSMEKWTKAYAKLTFRLSTEINAASHQSCDNEAAVWRDGEPDGYFPAIGRSGGR